MFLRAVACRAGAVLPAALRTIGCFAVAQDKVMYGGFDYGIIFVIIFTVAATARLIYYHVLDLHAHTRQSGPFRPPFPTRITTRTCLSLSSNC